MKLTICIPTYNRVEDLKRCISSLIISKNTDLEIIVQDNASDDGTKIYMESVIDNRVKYYRNAINIGMERNIVSIIEKATGDYVMYLTDDDFLFPNAIDKITSFIQEYRPSFFTSDIIVHLEKQNKAYNYNYFSKSCIFDSNQIEEIAKLYISTHVLTRCCFNKKLLTEEDLLYIQNYGVGNWYPHQLLLPLLYKKGSVGYIAEPLGIHTWENDTFWGIDPSQREILNAGHVNILLAINKIVDYDFFKQLVFKFSTTYSIIDQKLLVLLDSKDADLIEFNVKENLNRKNSSSLLKVWINNLIENNNYSIFEKKIAEVYEKKIAIFGTGEVANLLYLDGLKSDIPISFFLDNINKNKEFNGISIYTLDNLLEKDNIIRDLDVLIISVEGEHDINIMSELSKRINLYDVEIISWKDLF